MKNFFKTALLVILVVLLASTFFTSSAEKKSEILDSEIFQIESQDSFTDGKNEEIVVNEEGNIFAKIGAGISNIFYAILNFISSVIAQIFLIL